MPFFARRQLLGFFTIAACSFAAIATRPVAGQATEGPSNAAPNSSAQTNAVAVPEGAVPEGTAGRAVDDFALDDFRGRRWSLADFDDARVIVVAFLGTECPLVRLYAPRLVDLAETYAGRDVAFVGIMSNQQDSLAEIAHFARAFDVSFPLLKDAGNQVADQFDAQRTPEVFVVDRERQVRYRGRIDDQYTYGIQRPAVDHQYLRDAIEALVEGRAPPMARTDSVGCHIGRVLRPSADSDVTYSQQISRIFQRRCVSCHRSGEIAPFELTDYDEVVGWAGMIEEVVREQRMPPWHANPDHGDFANEARLTHEEKQLIFDWVAAGAPQGDPSDLPEPLEFVEGWRIGEPDLVVYMSDDPFQVQATGEVPYKYFTVDPGFTEDKWVQAAECRPGNRSVVHHIIVAPASRERVAARIHGDIESDWLAATAPGAQPMILPPGMAKRIPAGAKLVFQMHYTPVGTPQEDRSCIGLVFADPESVRHEVVTQKAASRHLRIPPGDANHEVTATFRFRDDSRILSMFPHMHLRGKSFRYTATYPDGREPEILLDIPRYEFNWQNAYAFSEPKRMPAGTLLTCVAHYDNSAENLANPDPTATVRWGDQTWEEMMIGYFDMIVDDAPVATSDKPETRVRRFLEEARKPDFRVNSRLLDDARSALGSNARLREWGTAVRKIVPQLDRVDWMTVEDGWLTIERAADASDGNRGAGQHFPSAALKVAGYAERDEVVVHADITSISAPDFRLMSRWFGSSMHVPVEIDGQRGVISFWSSDRDAFPDEAVAVLRELAGALGN